MKADDILAQKEIIDEDQIIISNSEEERIDWLSENIDPWTKVEQYWQETSVARRQLFLKNTEFTVHAYFEKFKCLSTQKGKELLELDFSLLYTNVTPIDYSEWKRIRDLLMNQFDMHKIKNAEELGLINSLKSGDLSNEKQDFLLMYLLVHLLPPKSRGRKRKATSENQEIVNQASSKKSLEERRESFILHVESDAEVEPKILELKKRLQIAKETFQPLIIAVGRNLTSIESYHIAVNDQLYELSNCLETVVVALKIFFSLDCEYPENTQVIWKFLQQVLLNIKEEKVVTVQMKTYFGLIKILQDNI
ncbi:uncharacterized protein LOC111693421 [Trichogramma pretiosum]|uniref:uncharacterized protein LOC106659937 n=1 Tax=Trichogramma pretiosum TaxID=7493 RepID=UPI0006C9B972|nr:uncharacterized protein LOC106659937 [Trichogramma pretiosum]XP_023313645.1 uncharacterized protein LOC111693372 [Trichogramma pretiosum]XP_023313761.1 uncharacterized protein LOC111693421 [Trichogramma pretiosum]